MTIDKSGNVGVGTTGPDTPLHIRKDLANNVRLLTLGNQLTGGWNGVGAGKIQSIVWRDNSDGQIVAGWGAVYDGTTSVDLTAFGLYNSTFRNETTRVFTIKGTGNVGIGLTNPAYQLQLSTDSAAKPSTNTWTIASDARIKTGIRPFNDSLSVIDKINPVWYRYNGKGGFEADGKDYIGVVAQDIEKVAPYTVNNYKAKLNANDTNDTELMNFNSHALTFVLINAVKEQQREIELLKSRVAALEKG